MLKLNASYSKKVPVDGQDFSSQSYHASVEVELPDGLTQEQLSARIHGTFQIVRDSVEAELHNGHATPAAATPAAQTPGESNTVTHPPCSPKQVKFLTDLAVRRKMTIQDLNEQARQRYGVSGIEALSKAQASEFIDLLNGESNGAHHRRAA
jgi:hypothetical protein